MARLLKVNKKVLFRITVSTALIAVLVYVLDFRQTIETLGQLNPKVLIAPACLLLLQTFISSYKWRCILLIDNAVIGLGYLFRTYFIGQFFSLFLPSSIGGDVYRVARIKDKVKSFTQRLSSVLFDRASGLYGLIVVGAFGAIGFMFSELIFVLIGLILVTPVMILILTRDSVIQTLADSDRHFIRSFGEVLSSHRRYLTSRKIWLVLFISILFHTNVVFINYLYSQALGMEITILELFMIVPLIYITDMIPLSINGIGVRDSAYAFFFAALGYVPEHAFALSLLVLAMRYVVGAVGGVLFLAETVARKGSPN
jgi:uncharacterized protein (TIRG00374 family)